MGERIDVFDRPIFMVTLDVYNLCVSGGPLKVVEGKVRLMVLGGKLGEVGSVFGVVGDRLKITEVSHDDDGVRLKISNEGESGRPCLFFLSRNVSIRNNGNPKWFIRAKNQALSFFRDVWADGMWVFILLALGFLLGILFKIP
jgi:hypothetical protein